MTEFTITYWNGHNHWGMDAWGIYKRFTIDCPSLEEAIKIAAEKLEELSYLDHCDLGMPKGWIIYPDTEYFAIDGTVYLIEHPVWDKFGDIISPGGISIAHDGYPYEEYPFHEEE